MTGKVSDYIWCDKCKYYIHVGVKQCRGTGEECPLKYALATPSGDGEE